MVRSTAGMRVIGIMTLAGVFAFAAVTPVEQARALYHRTDYAAALKLLLPLEIRDGHTWELAGKSYFMMGDFKRAGEAFQKAVAADPARSDSHLWLGRAFGRRAETSSPFTAPGLASKARQSFEKAIELNPRNAEAMNDLFEYYLQAPGFLGGGLDKAAALAARIRDLDPPEFHLAQAQLAEKRKEWGTAEQQLRRAVDLAPRQAGRLLDLAKFLARQGRHQESDAAFQQAARIEPASPRVLFERANTYIRTKRKIDEARLLLKKYLASPLTPDDPSREEAEKLLKQAGG
ncbi:MAG: tetratricopeptide repeat protein [Bryobacterales bacterium]|nr:tetratricopeptide repeat protein [Bryobacterales bacterium]